LSWAAAEWHPNWQGREQGTGSARFGHSIKCGSDRRRCESGKMRILPHFGGHSTDSPARQPAWRVLATLTRAGPHYPGPTIISCLLGNYATQLSLTCAGSRRRISSTLPIGFLFLLLPGNGIIIIALLPPLLMLSANTILNPSFIFK